MDFNSQKFVRALEMLGVASIITASVGAFGLSNRKLRVVLVGAGVRGTSFWGKRLVDQYPEILEFVGLADTNPGRLEYALKYMGVDCPVYSDFDKMLAEQNPDLVIVTTVDSTDRKSVVSGES